MFSLNAPVPGRVARIASELRPALSAFDSIRADHSLLLKRLGPADPTLERLTARVRQAVAGTPPIRARVDGVGVFTDPPRGTAPVVYLAVDSPGLVELHADLVAEFGAIDGLEGDQYVPHVTLARDGDPDAARRVADREFDPVEWTVTEFELHDAARGVVPRRISLPA